MKLKRYLEIHQDVQNEGGGTLTYLAGCADPEEWNEYNALTDSATDIEIAPPDDYAPASGAAEYGDDDELLEDFGDGGDGV